MSNTMNYLALRKRVAEVLEGSHKGDPIGRYIDLFLHVVILLNVVAITLESEESLHALYHPYFWRFEVFSVLVFSLEYVVRVWSCIDRPNATDRRPLRGRIAYMLTPMAIIDLVAILPFYLGLIVELDLRFLRVVRLLRVLKLTRYSPAVNVLLEVLRREAHVLGRPSSCCSSCWYWRRAVFTCSSTRYSRRPSAAYPVPCGGRWSR